jgi:hypothetical protein
MPRPLVWEVLTEHRKEHRSNLEPAAIRLTTHTPARGPRIADVQSLTDGDSTVREVRTQDTL